MTLIVLLSLYWGLIAGLVLLGRWVVRISVQDSAYRDTHIDTERVSADGRWWRGQDRRMG